MVTPEQAMVVTSVMLLVASIIVGLPWLTLHYIVQWRKAGSLRIEDERMLEDVWRAVRTMERRIESLETALVTQTPGSRRSREG
jgi:phage shock protein B